MKHDNSIQLTRGPRATEDQETYMDRGHNNYAVQGTYMSK